MPPDCKGMCSRAPFVDAGNLWVVLNHAYVVALSSYTYTSVMKSDLYISNSKRLVTENRMITAVCYVLFLSCKSQDRCLDFSDFSWPHIAAVAGGYKMGLLHCMNRCLFCSNIKIFLIFQLSSPHVEIP